MEDPLEKNSDKLHKGYPVGQDPAGWRVEVEPNSGRGHDFRVHPAHRGHEGSLAMPDGAIVHVVDDDEAARQSLAFLLRAHALDVRTYESATVFLKAAPGLQFGCIVTDVRMPDISGIDLLRRLKELNIFLPAIVITGHGDVPLAVEAMKLGAADFLEKPFDDEAMIGAVRWALRRGDDDRHRETERAEINERLASLSNRERDVLNGLVGGQANKQIAFELGISPRTVEIYRANLMTKMQARSLSELVRMALTSGILTSAGKPETPPKS
jgi:two-component system response regulator FixJ